MILPFRENCDLLEQIFVVLVSMQFGAIQNSSARSSCTRVCSSRLLTLKFFDHVIHFYLSRFLELHVVHITLSKDVILLTSSIFVCGGVHLVKLRLTVFPILLTTIMNFLIRDDQAIQEHLWTFDVNVLNSVGVVEFLQCFF